MPAASVTCTSTSPAGICAICQGSTRVTVSPAGTSSTFAVANSLLTVAETCESPPLPMLTATTASPATQRAAATAVTAGPAPEVVGSSAMNRATVTALMCGAQSLAFPSVIAPSSVCSDIGTVKSQKLFQA